MTATLRRMRWWDIESVTRLERELFAEDSWTDTMFWSELAERDTRWYVVAVDDDDVVGYAGLCVYAPGEAYVQTIGVTTRKQRHGLGTALLGALLAEAGQRGARQVDLEGVRTQGCRPSVGVDDEQLFFDPDGSHVFMIPSAAC